MCSMEGEPLITVCTALQGNASTFMSLGSKVRLIFHAQADTGSFRTVLSVIAKH